MAVDFGMALPPGPTKEQPDTWMEVLESALPVLQGHIRSLWMPDHFFWVDNPTYEAMTVLTYLATRYPDYEVGSSVLGQSYRNPAYLAKLAATLQVLSGGRFILGIGAGWKEDEYLAYDYAFPSAKIRLEQLEDTLQIIRLMWESTGPVSYEGKHYRIQNAYCEPRPDPAPPIMVGGGGNTTMLHAARYADWWNLSDASIETYQARLNILQHHCDTIGRDFSTIRKTYFGRLVLAGSEAEARVQAVTQGRSHYDGWTPDGALVGTPLQVVEQMQPFLNIGVDYFIVEILNIASPDVQQMVVEEVIPQVQAS